MDIRNSIMLGPTRKMLDRLHPAAKRDRLHYLSLIPREPSGSGFGVEYVQSGENGFASTILPMGEGFEYSVYVG